MNNILVGIDFEEGSLNALEHAIGIAQKAKLDILCIWVHKPDNLREKNTVENKDFLKETEKRFQELVDKYQDQLVDNKIEYKIRVGKVYKEIIAEAKKCKPYMLIIGTHGSSGFEEFWIGSNANKIVTASPCPVITIRAGRTVEKTLKVIILPLDSSIETRQKAPIAGVMAKHFDAEIHVVKIYTTHVKAVRRKVDGYTEQVMKYYHENEIKCKEVPLEVDNLTTDTIKYSNSVHAGLIVIMTEQETKTSNLWLGPYAHQMVNHSPIPVLSLHPKEIMRSLSR